MDQLSTKLLTISQAGKILGVSPKTLKRWEKAGKIKIPRTPTGNRFFTKESIEALKNNLGISQESAKIEILKGHKLSFPALPKPSFRFSAITIILVISILANFFLFSKTPYPHQAVLGVETFIAPAIAEGTPLGNLLGRVGSIFQRGTLVVTLIGGKEELDKEGNLNIKGKAIIAKDIEGLGDLKIKGKIISERLKTNIIDPYLIENDGDVQSTLQIKSVGSISLEPGEDSDVSFNDSSISNVKNITSKGTVTSSKLVVSSDLKIGGNITLTGSINGNTLNETKLVFSGSSPSIYPSTTNTGISINGNGTGAINIGNSSTGDVYIAGGSSDTGCTITNSNGSLNCSGNITSQADIDVRGGDLTTDKTTFNLINTTATTLNVGGAATTLSIGASSGTTTINNNLGIGTTTTSARVQIATGATGTIGQIIKAQASQTADFIQLRNSVDTILAKIDSSGNISGRTLESTVSTGTAPLTVSSTTVVSNLNASLLEGNSASTLLSQPQPNLVLNSDFSRRNKFMTFMPEVFSDTSGWTALIGTLGSVSSNILTAGTAGSNWLVRAGLSTWRDGRFSAQGKLVEDNNSAPIGIAAHVVDSSNLVFMELTKGTINDFRLWKRVVGADTQVGPAVTFTPVLNNWYWFEIEFQGTTAIAKLYSSGASPVAKASATLVGTITGTISDAGLASGYIGLKHSGGSTASQWGGLSTGDGGVYVEGWGPESWAVTFGGTKGGQAFGFDEAADSGPLSLQYTPVVFIPATSRTLTLTYDGYDGGLKSSTGYIHSAYVKNTTLGGSGTMVTFRTAEQTSASVDGTLTDVSDGAETTFTRKTSAAFTTASTARRFSHRILVNPSSTRTGTVRFSLPQLEEGSVATPWRNAPADDGPIVWILSGLVSPYSTTSTSYVEVDSRNLAVNAFLPWDAKVTATFAADHTNSGLNSNLLAILAAGSIMGGSTNQTQEDLDTANKYRQTAYTVGAGFSAGKTRFALDGSVTAGTMTITNNPAPSLIITATRGKFDLAEEYTVLDPTIEAGDVVKLTKSPLASKGESLQSYEGESHLGGVTTIERTDKGYDSSVLGIVSTDPGITLGNFNLNAGGTISSELNYNERYSRTNLRPVALQGRVPVKVTNENGSIRRGDILTSSEKYPGYSMKATRAGRSIGIAMEDLNCFQLQKDSPCEAKVLTFVNLSFYDPDVYLADSGQLVISNTTNTTNTTNDSITLGEDGLIAQTPKYQVTNTKTLEIVERTGAFNDLFVANLKVGNLDTSVINNDLIRSLELRIKNLELATTSAVLASSSLASSSGELISILSSIESNESSQSGILNNLTVLGKTVLNDLGVTGKITNGLLSINGLASQGESFQSYATIDTLSGDLYLQNLGVGGVNILNGKVTIDVSGNLKLEAGSLTARKININDSDILSRSVGSVTLTAGQTEVQVQTSALTPNSYVFATPDKPVALGVKTNEGTIFVSIKEALTEDLKINWWIVN